MTKGGTTLTPTMWVSEADPAKDIALFVIAPTLFDSVNPWTVTAIQGTNTASTTVLITTNKEYEVALSYWNGELYDSGNQYPSVTGGWSATYGQNDFHADSDGLRLQTGSICVVATENAIDLTNWSTIKANVNVTASSGNGKMGISTSRPTDDNTSIPRRTEFSGTGIKTISLDISTISGLYYVAVTGYHMTEKFTKIWLE
jgi:hypothetical protein